MKTNSVLIATSLALALSACGGGGGGSTPSTPAVAANPTPTPLPPVSPPAPPTTTPPVTPPAPAPVINPPTPPAPGSTITGVTTVPSTNPTYTYPAGSQQQIFVSAINNFRALVQLMPVTQNKPLDNASSNHAVYIAAHPEIDFSASTSTGVPVFHTEDSTKNYFTGTLPPDRAAYATYGTRSVGEVGTTGVLDSAGSIAKFINSIFHREGLMNQQIADIGIATATNTTVGDILVAMTGIPPVVQLNNYFGVYPIQGQTGLPVCMLLEAPNAFADVTSANAASSTSSPISINSTLGSKLNVSSFVITDRATGAVVPMRSAVTSTQFPNDLMPNSAYFVGKAPFKVSTVYDANVTGDVDGTPLSYHWSFTTGTDTTCH